MTRAIPISESQISAHVFKGDYSIYKINSSEAAGIEC